MKLIIGLIFVIISTYLGYCFSAKYVKKRRFYQSFNEFNQTMLNEVAFSKKTLREITEGNDDIFFKLAWNYIENGEVNLFKNNGYSDSEKIFIKNYLKELGNTDSKAQIVFLNSSVSSISKNLDECIENEKKYKSLYVKLGFLFGAIILIILI